MPLDLGSIKQGIEREKTKRRKSMLIRRFFWVLALLFVTEILLSIFVLATSEMVGESMLPRLKSGDFIVYNRLITKPWQGGIVVIDGATSGYDVKRAIATEGDVVDLTADGIVAVNNVRLAEPYAITPTAADDLIFPQTVPADHVFVLGDNRPVSKDSRNSAVGMISQKDIKGTLMFSIPQD